MRQSKIHGATFFMSLIAVIALATTPVFAHHNENGSDTSVSSQQDGRPYKGHDVGQTEPSKSQIKHSTFLVKQHGKKMLEQRREGKKLKTVAQRQRMCQNIQKAVNNKLKAFNNHADKYLIRLNTLFADVQAYQAEHAVKLSNYEALGSVASTNQADAMTAVATLKSLGDTINCASSDPASMLTDAKEAASNARDALKNYQKSLKDLVVALVQAGKSDDSAAAAEGGN